MGDLSAVITQHFLLLQQFSRWGFCSCIPQRGIHFVTQTFSFSVTIMQTLHLSPSSCSFSRSFLHLGHQIASSIVARSQGGPPFLSPSWAPRGARAQSRTRAAGRIFMKSLTI